MFKLIPARYVFHRRSWTLGGMTIRKAQNLAKIWNNAGYRENRRLVSNPTILAGNPQFKDSFCYGCRKITDITPRNAHT